MPSPVKPLLALQDNVTVARETYWKSWESAIFIVPAPLVLNWLILVQCIHVNISVHGCEIIVIQAVISAQRYCHYTWIKQNTVSSFQVFVLCVKLKLRAQYQRDKSKFLRDFLKTAKLLTLRRVILCALILSVQEPVATCTAEVVEPISFLFYELPQIWCDEIQVPLMPGSHYTTFLSVLTVTMSHYAIVES